MLVSDYTEMRSAGLRSANKHSRGRGFCVPAMVWLLCLITLPFSGTLVAQEDRALMRAQQMLKQLNGEKARIQQELVQLQQEYSSYRRDTEKAMAASERKQKKLAASIASLQQQGKQTDSQLDETRIALQREQTTAASLQQWLRQQSQNLEVCKNNNDALASTAYDLINLYNDKGFSEVLIKKEPLTGIARVKVENIVQGFEDKVIDHELSENPQLLTPLNGEPVPVAKTNEDR